VCLKWQIVDYLMVLAVQWPLLTIAIEHTSVQKLREFVLDAGLESSKLSPRMISDNCMLGD